MIKDIPISTTAHEDHRQGTRGSFYSCGQAAMDHLDHDHQSGLVAPHARLESCVSTAAQRPETTSWVGRPAGRRSSTSRLTTPCHKIAATFRAGL